MRQLPVYIRIRKTLIALALLSASLLIIACYDSGGYDTMQVMTFNIRYNNPDDGQDAWPNRKDAVVSMIKQIRPDILGLQEVLAGQIDDLDAQLSTYGHFGVGRDDGLQAGEFSPIFYNKNRLILQNQSTYWLSLTPDVPSKGWDAALERIVTWGHFKNIQTGYEFYVFNTHFDHMGMIARRESAKLILKNIRKIAGEAPVMLLGDFNVIPDSEPYAVLTNTLTDSGKPVLYDSRIFDQSKYDGPRVTFSGFDPQNPVADILIDYIFVDQSFEILSYNILQDEVRGRYLSDHRPVLITTKEIK